MGTLKRKAIKGVLWNAIERFSSQGIAFIISIILARLLTPYDYGLIAMIGIFISLSQAFVDSGFSSAIVRKNDRTESDLATAFYSNVVIGIICYIILFASAPLIAHFYQEPKLSSIIRVMSITFVLFSFANIQQAILTFRIDFKTKTKLSLISTIFSGVIGIILAYKGLGVWALVIQQVMAAFIRTSLLWIFVKWKPQQHFSKSSFRNLFSFSSKMLASNILSSISDNLYTIVIGKKFSTSSLGLYSRAEQFAQFPSINITNIVKGVFFPTMAIIQDEKEQFINSYYKVQQLVALIVFPLMIGLASVASPLILIVLSEKWVYSTHLLQIICLGLMWYPVYTLNLNILEIKGESGYLLKSEFISKIINISILITSIPFGLVGICIGRVIYSLISVSISHYFVSKTISVSYFHLFHLIGKNLIIALLMGGFSYFSQQFVLSSIEKLTIGVSVGVISYMLLNYLLNYRNITMLFNTIIKK